MGILSGKRPSDLGVTAGQLRKGNWKPNYVHSQVPSSDSHYAAPLAVHTTAAWQKLLAQVNALPRVALITETNDYAHFECSTAVGFIDDLELYFDGKAVQLMSCARLGIRDFEVNRKRVESLRRRLS
jgi:uncharacterized protein (DUF1499 family)